MISVEFLVTALIVVLIPGTGVMYTVSTGLVQKSRASIAAAVGCTLGIVPHLAASIFFFIRICGSLYLAYLAWTMWRSRDDFAVNAADIKKSVMDTVVKGIVINLLNPKLTLFFFSFLPQFVPVNAPNLTFLMLRLSLVFMLMTLVVFVCYGLFASALSRWLAASKRSLGIMKKTFAVIFAALALKLALTEE